MNETNKYHIITMILGLFVGLPIWFYLLYNILSYMSADRLLWFLYWIYVPVNILIVILGKIGDMNK